MANPTTNYGFVMPTSTDLVTDLPADFDVFGQAVDNQMLTNANAAIAKTIVDAKGDIIAATAADTVSRLAVGANNTVLTADSSTATGLKWAAAAAGGKVLQVVSATTSTSVSNSTTTPADTGLTATITPTSASSKILVMISQPINTTRSSDQAGGGWSLLRGATVVYDMTGASALGTLYMRSIGSNTSTEYYGVLPMIYLDSPATTSATTYKTRQRVYQATSSANTTSQSDGATSSIVLMEIGA